MVSFDSNAVTASHSQYKLTIGDDYLSANVLKSGAGGYKQIMEQNPGSEESLNFANFNAALKT